MSNGRQRPLRIGLTGGIASGKSTITGMFAELGVPVIDTDEIARAVVAPGQPGLTAVIDRFGPDMLTPAGELDRRRLREHVFADDTARNDLNAILHPLIRAHALEQADQIEAPYLIMVVPLLVESGFDALTDRVLVVDCDEEQQKKRLIARDGETPDSSARMLAAQTGRRRRLVAADDVIDNSGSLEDTRLRVTELHDNYLLLAAGH